MLAATPVSGVIADRLPRRMLALLGIAACFAGILALAAFSYLGSRHIGGFFLISVLLGLVRAFAGPALSAMLGDLTTLAERPRAVALVSSNFQLANVVGPALGGVSLGLFGATTTYVLACALLFFAALIMLTVPQKPAQVMEREASPILAGLAFVRSRRAMLGAISLDMFAVVLGGAVALLPAVVQDLLHGGPEELGVLRAAPAIGAIVVGAALTRSPLARHAGPAMLIAVAVYGFATIAFGLAQTFLAAFIALTVAGAADMVSVYVRQSLVQLETPDAMRGRVSAVSMVFISASNEIGDLESGLVAAAIGVQNAVLVGGLAAIVIACVFAWRFPELRTLDRLGGEHAT
jgi:MFS family permease